MICRLAIKKWSSEMLKTPAEIGTRAWYWLLLIVLGLLLEGVALFYQYVLDYGPCVLCIHARIWVLGFILAAVLGLFVLKFAVLRIFSHALTVGMAAGLLERSWKALGVERGTVEGSCSMDSGLPYWFALDEWLPLVFKVWEPCGYTPELMFGISIAEALVVISAGMLLLGLVMTITAVAGRRHT